MCFKLLYYCLHLFFPHYFRSFQLTNKLIKKLKKNINYQFNEIFVFDHAHFEFFEKKFLKNILNEKIKNFFYQHYIFYYDEHYENYLVCCFCANILHQLINPNYYLQENNYEFNINEVEYHVISSYKYNLYFIQKKLILFNTKNTSEQRLINIEFNKHLKETIQSIDFVKNGDLFLNQYHEFKNNKLKIKYT